MKVLPGKEQSYKSVDIMADPEDAGPYPRVPQHSAFTWNDDHSQSISGNWSTCHAAKKLGYDLT